MRHTDRQTVATTLDREGMANLRRVARAMRRRTIADTLRQLVEDAAERIRTSRKQQQEVEA